MKKVLFLLLFICFYALGVKAQDIVVIGQVMSADDGTPLESVNVWFKGTDIGTTTNKDGFFMLRSPIPQNSLEVSIVGYKKRSIKLDKGKDQVLQVYMREDVNLLDEILVMPGDNPANAIVKEVIAHKHLNNPDLISDIAYEQTTLTSIDLTDIPQKAQQRRLLKALNRGNLSASDSSFLIPVYLCFETDSVVVAGDSSKLIDAYTNEKAFEIMAPKQWRSYFNSYLPEVNFYRNYISIFDKTFVSPLSVQSKSFYNYLLTDSIEVDGQKVYEITFYPKNDKNLVFKGNMWIDGQSYALLSIDAMMSSMANINFVDNLQFVQRFERIGNKYYYSHKSKSAVVKFSTAVGNRVVFGSLLSQKSDFDNLRLVSDSVETLPMPDYNKNVPEGGLERTWSAMDSLNQTRIRKLAYLAVDVGLNGYLHVWKFDIGPLLNFFNYNLLEGARPLFSMRTGQSMWENVTLGGYVGYGFGDRKWKYGGEAQVRFGKEHANTFSLFYDRRIFRYGFDQVNLYQENKVEQYDHLFNWFFSMDAFPFNALRDRATISYKYEYKGLKITTEARGSKTYSNPYIPFIQQGVAEDAVSSLSLYADLRLSWKEQTLNSYFRRHYLRTNYPIVHVVAEAGIYKVGNYQNPYGKLNLVVKQRAPIYIGKLHYMVEGCWVMGSVPFPELFITRGTRGFYYTYTNFALLQQSEFAADLYMGGHFRYESNGYLFNMIPYLKRLNMRENLIFNIGYGGLDRQKHDKILTIPVFMKSFKEPYMEFGFGVSNILNFVTVESMWRLTYRHNTDGPLWALRARFDLNF